MNPIMTGFNKISVGIPAVCYDNIRIFRMRFQTLDQLIILSLLLLCFSVCLKRFLPLVWKFLFVFRKEDFQRIEESIDVFPNGQNRLSVLEMMGTMIVCF